MRLSLNLPFALVLVLGAFVGCDDDTATAPSALPAPAVPEPHASAEGTLTKGVRGPDAKVVLCHRTGSGSYIRIEVSQNAESAHRAHGDGAPGEAVPATPGKIFDGECAMVDEQPAIDIEKATNGEDADAPPGPTVPMGELVTWTYVVTNVGTMSLADVSVLDDRGVVPDCPATVLAPGASMTCVGQGTALAGQYRNVGSVSAMGTDGTVVTDSDPSHYLGQLDGGPVTLSVSRDGAGTGNVTSLPPGIDCGSVCSAVFDPVGVVSLVATADPGSVFGAWGGHPDCEDGTVVPDADKSCVATFDLAPPPPSEFRTLLVTKAGSGSGQVVSDPAGIDCGADCTSAFLHGSRVTLQAVPDPGSQFVGFDGDAGCGAGELLMDRDKTCTATFELLPPPPAGATLRVIVEPAGGGVVSTSPAGIFCLSDCSADFPLGTVVRLSGREEPGFSPVVWSGDPDCADAEVTMDADKTCTASF